MIGDKYVIEIAEEFTDSNNNKLYRIKGFNSLVFDKNGLYKLTKYKDYEEALDKACEQLSKFQKVIYIEQGIDEEFANSSKEWKERLLK